MLLTSTRSTAAKKRFTSRRETALPAPSVVLILISMSSALGAKVPMVKSDGDIPTAERFVDKDTEAKF